jgi:hypothetical protein
MSSIEEIIEKWIKHNNPRRILDLSNWDITELPDIPDSVEWLKISNTAIKEIKCLPKSLKWLKCCKSDIVKISTPLPKGLIYINCRGCENLVPFEVPPGVICKSDFKEYIEELELKTEDHYMIAQKRINYWNKTKNPNKILDLSYLQFETFPEIHPSVEILHCNGNRKLKSLKGLPKILKYLSCSGYNQKVFDYLPENLEYLICNSSNIEVLDNLPSTLKKLKMQYYSAVHTIKSLPSGLRELDLYLADNLEEILCPWPETLRVLDLGLSRVSILPTLPESLRVFDISMNPRIKNIPNIPNKMKALYCNGTNLLSLPQLPDGLLKLEICRVNILNNNSLPNSICYFNSDTIRIERENFKIYN